MINLHLRDGRALQFHERTRMMVARHKGDNYWDVAQEKAADIKRGDWIGIGEGWRGEWVEVVGVYRITDLPRFCSLIKEPTDG